MASFIRVNGKLVNAAQRSQIIKPTAQVKNLRLRWCQVIEIYGNRLSLHEMSMREHFRKVVARLPDCEKACTGMRVRDLLKDHYCHFILGELADGSTEVKAIIWSPNMGCMHRGLINTYFGTVMNVKHTVKDMPCGGACAAHRLALDVPGFGHVRLTIPCLWQKHVSRVVDSLIDEQVVVFMEDATPKGISGPRIS